MTLEHILKEFDRLGLNEQQGMGLLADSHAISDNCIRIRDIATVDIPNAVAWLKRQKPNAIYV